MEKAEVVREMERTRLVAVVRSKSSEEALATVRGVTEAGVRFVEITLTVPGALGLIKDLARQEGFCVGAGTVLAKDDAEQAINNGARFVVSPTLELDLIPVCREAGVICVSGAATPTEILTAIRAQADMVKIFPADCLGGPHFVRQMVRPLPKVRFVVSGGVNRGNVEEYVQLGVTGLALGSAFLADVLAKRGHNGLVSEVGEFVKLVEKTLIKSNA